MKKPVKILLVVLAVFILLAAAGAILISASTKKLNALAQMRIEDVDLTTVPDGSYTGEHSVFPVSVKVSVTVKDHHITAIDLIKHFNGQGGAAEVIPENIVKAQTLQVDSISGATYSSKVILLAIQDALLSAIPTK